MARPTVSGLDYFPLDTNIDQDDKIALIESDYGIEGFGIVIKLLMKIYSEGYFYGWGEKEQKLFSRRLNVDINTVSDVVNACIKWELFDNSLYENYQILTSKGIQKRYLEATTRRKEVEFINEYLLLNNSESTKYTNLVFVNINPQSTGINVDINSDTNKSMSTETPQSKVKESKVKESINIVEQKPDPIPYKEIVEYLNKVCGTSYRPSTKKTKDLIKARFNEGFKINDFKTVIDKKSKEWLKDSKMNQYLRPQTLFGTNFESYLNQKDVIKNERPKPDHWITSDLSQIDLSKSREVPWMSDDD